VVDRTASVSHDAWLGQYVGGSTAYGNGTGPYITIGPKPNDDPDGPDLKSRGVFHVPLSTLLDEATSVDLATFEAVVAPVDCVGSRGGTIRILLEECLSSFTELTAVGNCNVASGTGTGVWPGPAIAQVNRALHSSTTHSDGDVLEWDITDLLEAKRAAGATDLYFRLIAANADGSAYDETNAARRITVYSSEDATTPNRPRIAATVTTGVVDKSDSDTIALTDSEQGVIEDTTQLLFDTDTLELIDDEVVGTQAVVWEIVYDTTTDEGTGRVTLGSAGSNGIALLNAVSADDVLLTCRVAIDRVPVNDFAYFRLLARVQSIDTYYRLSMRVDARQAASLLVEKVVEGTATELLEILNARTIVPATSYLARLKIEGTSPATLSVKFWRSSQQEPDWQPSVEDSESALQAAGAIGLGAALGDEIANAPIAFLFDNFEVVAP
jgi:hypothetical protein